MSELVGLYLDRLDLPGARVRREPYIVAVTVTERPLSDVRVHTKPFRRVTRSRPVDQTVELHAPCDPGGFFACDLVIMESDADFRRAGDLIAGARHLMTDTALGRAVTAGLGLGSLGLAGAGVREALDVLAGRLKDNGDDQIDRFEIRVTNEDARWSRRPGSTWRMAGNRSVISLRLDDRPAARIHGFVSPRRWADVATGQRAAIFINDTLHLGEVRAVGSGRSATLWVRDAGGDEEYRTIIAERLRDFEVAVTGAEAEP